MAAEKYGEKRHKTTLRFHHETYSEIQAQAKFLGMSVAAYVNMVIAEKTEDVQKHFVEKEKRRYQIVMDDDTKKRIDELTRTLNSASTQLRLAGTNFNTFLRDVRLGILPMDLSAAVASVNGKKVTLEDFLKAVADQVSVSAETIRWTSGQLDEKINEIDTKEVVFMGPWGMFFDDYYDDSLKEDYKGEYEKICEEADEYIEDIEE